MNKISTYILTSLIFISCSNLNERNINYGTVSLKNGRIGKKTWKEDLLFKRLSWFSKAARDSDLLIAKVSKESLFALWFEKGEQKFLNNCQQILVVLNHNHHKTRGNRSFFKSYFEKNGYERIVAPLFLSHLSSHPDYTNWKLGSYKKMLLCGKTANEEMSFILPSYDEVRITP